MTTVLSVIFSGWHPHHLGQTGHLHQGVVLPQQSGLQRSSFSSQLVRRDHNLEQVTARGSWRPNSRMFKRFYYRTQAQATTTVTSLVTLIIYFWAKINISISHTDIPCWVLHTFLVGVFEYVKTQCMSFEPNTFPVWAEKQGILGCVQLRLCFTEEELQTWQSD